MTAQGVDQQYAEERIVFDEDLSNISIATPEASLPHSEAMSVEQTSSLTQSSEFSKLSPSVNIELPPTILDLIVTAIADALQQLEAELFKSEPETEEEQNLSEDQEMLLEEELKRLARVKELQEKAVNLQRLLQNQLLGDEGLPVLEEELDGLTETQLRQFLIELEETRAWLQKKGIALEYLGQPTTSQVPQSAEQPCLTAAPHPSQASSRSRTKLSVGLQRAGKTLSHFRKRKKG